MTQQQMFEEMYEHLGQVISAEREYSAGFLKDKTAVFLHPKRVERMEALLDKIDRRMEGKK